MTHRATYPAALAALAALVVLCYVGTAGAEADEATLKRRFKQRYPVLVELKSTGKLGETYDGWIDAVQPVFLTEKAPTPDSPRATISELIDSENRDRRTLYELLAKRTRSTPTVVAKRNARRNFDRAGPDEHLKVARDKWILKRELISR